MAKRKEPRTSESDTASKNVRAHSTADISHNQTDTQEITNFENASSPSVRLRWTVSLLVVSHLVALVIAMSANLAPSFVHGELLAWLAPIHSTTAQDYTLLPLDLTHAAPIDAPLVIEVREAQQAEWRRLPLPQVTQSPQGLDFSSSRWPNLSRLLYWIAEQQPDSEVLHAFCAQAVRFAESNSTGKLEVAEIRLFQPHVISFDEDLIVSGGQGALISDTLAGKSVYAARVVRSSDGEIGLVPEQEPLRTSKPSSALSSPSAIGDPK